MLRARRRFHTYSLNNQLLICIQYPTATRVAGYRQWASMGRQVRKGEKAIWILAPMAYTREDDAGDKVVGIRGFKAVPVFALEQTDGEPLPELDEPEVRACPRGLFEDLVQVAAAGGCEVYSPQPHDGPPTAKGWLDLGNRRIAVRLSTEPEMAATLLHELGHAFDPELDGVALYAHGERRDAELVAESTAHLLSVDLGVDLAGSDVFYLAAWDGTLENLWRLTGRITVAHRAVRTLLVEANLVDG
jgi:antirestriction protein ArdC